MPTRGFAQGSDVLALDVDGVLVHPIGGWTAWDAEIETDLGIDPKVLGTSFFRLRWGDVVIGSVDLKAALSEFLSEIGSGVSPREFMDYWFEKDGEIDHRVLQAVRSWKSGSPDRRVVAVSNQEPYRIEYLLETLRLREIFDAGLWSCELGVTKSKAEFYQLANEGLMQGARVVTFFDDEEKHVSLARGAGWRACVFHSSDELAKELGV